MSDRNGSERLFGGGTPTAFAGGTESGGREMTEAERGAVVEAGNAFAQHAGGVWLLISGRFTWSEAGSTESRIKDGLLCAFGYPDPGEAGRTLNVLLDSPGGSLDSAYATALYLSAYTRDLRVYVPNRAKSASTLLAVGAHRLYLSAFGELGPLDTQLPDPRNPATTVSALDCYQSVDYVRAFGIRTVSEVLDQLVRSTGRRISINELLDKASAFAREAITPMMGSVTALDFGGWGRSLRIGEHYARKLLEAKAGESADAGQINAIAERLVFGYTHHFFPIDYHEALGIGLDVELMEKGIYEKAIEVVELCRGKDFAGFISREQSGLERGAASRRAAQRPRDGRDAPAEDLAHDEEPRENTAEVHQSTSYGE